MSLTSDPIHHFMEITSTIEKSFNNKDYSELNNIIPKAVKYFNTHISCLSQRDDPYLFNNYVLNSFFTSLKKIDNFYKNYIFDSETYKFYPNSLYGKTLLYIVKNRKNMNKENIKYEKLLPPMIEEDLLSFMCINEK